MAAGLVMATSVLTHLFSAGVASITLADATVAVVLSIPPRAYDGLEVVIPRLGVFSKVGFAAAVGCREDDAIENAMAGGDDRLKKLDERVLDGVTKKNGEAEQSRQWNGISILSI